MTSHASLIRDLRVARGRIWNVDEVVRRFPLGNADAPWNRGVKVSEESWLDEFVFQGFCRYGKDFLAHLRGRFAAAHFDADQHRLFLARDWIGELPLHVLASPQKFFIANTIGAIKVDATDEYAYAYVRAFPQAHVQFIDLSEVDPKCVALTMRPHEQQLYCDFAEFVDHAARDVGYELNHAAAEHLRALLVGSIVRRARSLPNRHAILLSGGLDSFSVALAMKASRLDFKAYTLSVDGGGEDLAMAIEFAKRLEVPHEVIRVTASDVVAAFDDAITASEYYPLYNVYCAVGMLLMAKRLSDLGVRSAFCGEAVNEAVGDYKDWEVFDPRSGASIILQQINEDRLQRTKERQALVWGNARDNGKYNKQLGTGLGKHAASRMVKPFLANGLTLECPYYEPQLLAHLVAIPPEVIRDLGGKPGLVAAIFEQDLKRFGIGRNMVESCKKVRLQDASEGGRGGLTEILLANGRDQLRAIEAFNKTFGAALNPLLDGRRLAWNAGQGGG